MPRIVDYTTLKDAVISAAEDSSTEFASYFDAALGLAEEYLLDSLDFVELKKIETLVCIPGENLLAKPDDYLAPFDAVVTSHLDVVEDRTVKFTQSDYIYLYWRDGDDLGPPVYYADYDDEHFILGPTPSQDFEIELTYLAKSPPLTTSEPVNNLIERVPNLLFLRVMYEMYHFQKAYEEAAIWEGKYDKAAALVNNRGRRQRRDSGTNANPTTSTVNTFSGD